MKTKFITHSNEHFPEIISSAFRHLLEEKHLYQNYEIDISSLRKMAETLNAMDDFSTILQYVWNPIINNKKAEVSVETKQVYFKVPTINIFCPTCKSIEPFKPYKSTPIYIGYPKILQVFIFQYQCRACSNTPNVFMIYRKNLKITLSGRALIEQFRLPKFIPKSQREFFSDAMIAHNSGKTLCGLFLLRTFIEQYTRQFSPNPSLLSDRVIELYMKSLPQDFKSKYPSLSNIWIVLSSALHNADASEDLFDETREKLIEFFEAKKIFGIDDNKIKTKIEKEYKLK